MSRFADAADTVPQPCQVFGTRLRPFCLGHHLLFRRLGIPLANNPDAQTTAAQLLMAVAICAANYDETVELIVSGDWPTVFDRWQKKVQRRKWFRPADGRQSENLFRSYLRTGYEMPPVWRSKNAHGLEITSPWEQSLLCRLVMSGFSQSEVMNGYLPAVQYHYYTVIEIDAAAKCQNVKHWRKVFYTEAHHRALKGVGQ